jgi:hypothetical protein
MSSSVSCRRSGFSLSLCSCLTLFLAGGFFFGSDASAGQEITVLSPEIHLYNSPLVLEYSLDETLKTGEPTKTTRFAMHSCRGLTIERLELQVVRFDKDKFVTLRGSITMNNNSGKDKKATVVFDVLGDDSEKVHTSATLKKARVPTGETPSSEIGIPLPTELMPVNFKYFGPNKDILKHHVRLRITLSLEDY